jgi:hypothetical protein
MPEPLDIEPRLSTVGAQATESRHENPSDISFANVHRASSVVMVAPKFWGLTCLSKSFMECFGNIWHSTDQSVSSGSASNPVRSVHIGYPPVDQMQRAPIQYPEAVAPGFPPMPTRNAPPLHSGKQSGKVTLEALDLAKQRSAEKGPRRKPSEFLTEKQRKAIEAYAGFASYSINKHLCQSAILPADVESAHKHIQSGLASMKAEGYGKEGVTYKGVAPHYFVDNLAGRLGTVTEYFSTSEDEGVAKSFAKLRNGALIKVFGDDGVDIQSLSPLQNSEEKEVLYSESTSFLIGKKSLHNNGSKYPLAITQDRVRGDGKYHVPTSNPTKEQVIALQALTQRLQERLGEDPALKQLATLLERIKDDIPAVESSGLIRNIEDNRFSIDDLSPVEHTSLVLRQVNELVSLLPPRARKAVDREMRAIESALRPLAADWRCLAERAGAANRQSQRAVELPERATTTFSKEATMLANSPPANSVTTLQDQLDSLVENKNVISRKEYADRILEMLPQLGDFNTSEIQSEELIGLIDEYLEEAACQSMGNSVFELKVANALMQQLKMNDRLFNQQSEIVKAVSHVANYSLTRPREQQQLGDLISILEEAVENLDVASYDVENLLPILRNKQL